MKRNETKMKIIIIIQRIFVKKKQKSKIQRKKKRKRGFQGVPFETPPKMIPLYEMLQEIVQQLWFLTMKYVFFFFKKKQKRSHAAPQKEKNALSQKK